MSVSYFFEYTHIYIFIQHSSHFYIAEIAHSILNFLLAITRINHGDRHVRSSFIHTCVNLQTVIKLQRMSIVTPRPVNQRWKIRRATVRQRLNSARYSLNRNLRNKYSFPLFPRQLSLSPNGIANPNTRKGEASNSKTLRKGNGDALI